MPTPPATRGDGNAPETGPPATWVTHRDSAPVRFLRMLRNRRWAFLLALLILPAAAAALTLARGSEFEATTTLLLRPAVGQRGAAGRSRSRREHQRRPDRPAIGRRHSRTEAGRFPR